MREIIGKLEFIKIKHVCSEKDTVKRMRRQAKEWEKSFAKYISGKGLFSEIYKLLLKLNNKETICLKKWAKDLNRHVTKEDTQMTVKYVKRCSASHAIREIQIKTTMRQHYTHIKMPQIQNSNTTKY